MYTVTVSRLPDECSEDELIAHFAKICPQHKIANISMAFDNRQEIEEASKRGDIIRAKVRAVHVSPVHRPLPDIGHMKSAVAICARLPSVTSSLKSVNLHCSLHTYSQ